MPAPPSTNITVQRIPSALLPSSPHLPPLIPLLNHAFTTSWRTIPGIVGDDYVRYETAEQFVGDMGVGGVTWAVFEGGEGGKEGRVVATAGYKPWEKVWKTGQRFKKGEREGQGAQQVEQGKVDEGQEKAEAEEEQAEMDKFEVVAVAVDPTLQDMGLASRLCKEIDEEIRDRLRKDGKKRATLMVRAGKELVEGYWTRKGYRTVHELKFPIGEIGSKTGFSIMEMERVLEV